MTVRALLLLSHRIPNLLCYRWRGSACTSASSSCSPGIVAPLNWPMWALCGSPTCSAGVCVCVCSNSGRQRLKGNAAERPSAVQLLSWRSASVCLVIRECVSSHLRELHQKQMNSYIILLLLHQFTRLKKIPSFYLMDMKSYSIYEMKSTFFSGIKTSTQGGSTLSLSTPSSFTHVVATCKPQVSYWIKVRGLRLQREEGDVSVGSISLFIWTC